MKIIIFYPNNYGSGGGGGGTPPGDTPVSSVTTLSRGGITWNFAGTVSAGQFANGDYFAVAPASVSSISPSTTIITNFSTLSHGVQAYRVMHGSMINPAPGSTNGFDTWAHKSALANTEYQASLNVASGINAVSPLYLSGNQSLVSMQSKLVDDSSYCVCEKLAVLTILSSIPPSGSMRPGYMTSDKSIKFNISSLDLSILQNVAIVASADGFGGGNGLGNTPTGISEYHKYFSGTWFDQHWGYTGEYMHPSANMPSYYREFNSMFGKGMILLNVSGTDADKRTLAISMAQIGIDYYQNYLAGWHIDGLIGHLSGKKGPMVLAGVLFNNSAILNYVSSNQCVFNGPGDPGNVCTFTEDGQTFIVAETSPGVYNWGWGGYQASDVGTAEWGNYHFTNVSSDCSNWDSSHIYYTPCFAHDGNYDDYRRCCSANGWAGTVLGFRMMGKSAYLYNTATVNYMDRYMSTEGQYSGYNSGTRQWDSWARGMWDTYRSSY